MDEFVSTNASSTTTRRAISPIRLGARLRVAAPRGTWRFDREAAPIGKPMFAREPESTRVLIALREEGGWSLISREGELKPLDSVASWAPLMSALT